MIPIIAGSRPEQVLENLAGCSLRLSADQIGMLDSAGDPDIKQAWLR